MFGSLWLNESGEEKNGVLLQNLEASKLETKSAETAGFPSPGSNVTLKRKDYRRTPDENNKLRQYKIPKKFASPHKYNIRLDPDRHAESNQIDLSKDQYSDISTKSQYDSHSVKPQYESMSMNKSQLDNYSEKSPYENNSVKSEYPHCLPKSQYENISVKPQYNNHSVKSEFQHSLEKSQYETQSVKSQYQNHVMNPEYENHAVKSVYPPPPLPPQLNQRHFLEPQDRAPVLPFQAYTHILNHFTFQPFKMNGLV